MLVFSVLIFSFGCAKRASYKEFKPLEVGDDQGVAIGKIKVVYKGKENFQQCIVTIGSKITLLSKEGLIFVALDEGKAEITEVNCRDENDKISQNNNFKNAEFTVSNGVNYFGDVTIVWSNPEPQSAASMILMVLGPIGGGIGGAIQAKKDGKISMSVEDNMEEVLNVYKKQVGDETIQAKKKIVTIGTQAE
ncbi:MAG: hypothetical protein IID18_07750 [Nitrospinae bacterium]|nr:hypothetical protein [Nitrospinota bacterium]